jgi:hypothetical protein
MEISNNVLNYLRAGLDAQISLLEIGIFDYSSGFPSNLKPEHFPQIYIALAEGMEFYNAYRKEDELNSRFEQLKQLYELQ